MFDDLKKYGYINEQAIFDENGSIQGHYYTNKYNYGSIYVPIDIENVDSVVCCLPGQNGAGSITYSDVVENIHTGNAPDYIMCFNPNDSSTNLCLDVVNAANNNGANINNVGVMDFSYSGNAGMVTGGNVSAQYPDIDVRIANIDASLLDTYNKFAGRYLNGNVNVPNAEAIDANINNQVTVLTVLPDECSWEDENYIKEQCKIMNETGHNSYLIISDTNSHEGFRIQFIANGGLDWLAGKGELKEDTYLSCQYYDPTTQTWIDSDINLVAPIKSDIITIENAQDLLNLISKNDIKNNVALSFDSTSNLLSEEQTAINKIYAAAEKLQNALIGEIKNIIYAGNEYENMDKYLKLDSDKLNEILKIDLGQYRKEMITLHNEEEVVLYTIDGFNGLLKKSVYDRANLTAEDINMLIESELNNPRYLNKPSTLRGTGEAWIRAAEETGLDPLFLLAIARHESGMGTSDYSLKYNNHFGMKYQNGTQYFGWKNDVWQGKIYADTPEEGILRGAHWIKDFYIEQCIDEYCRDKSRTTENFVKTGYSGDGGDTQFRNELVGIMDRMKEAYKTNTGKELEFISNNGTVPDPTWTPGSSKSGTGPKIGSVPGGWYGGSGVDSGTEPTTSTGTEPTTSTGTKPTTSTGTEPTTSTGTEPTTSTGTEPTTSTGTEPTTSTGTEPTTSTGTEPTTSTGTEPTTRPITEPSTSTSSRPIAKPSTRPTTRPNINIKPSENIEHLTTETPPINDIPEILPTDNYESFEPIESYEPIETIEPITDTNETINNESAKGNSALNGIGIAAGIGAAAGAGIYVAKKLKNKDKNNDDDDDEIYGVENDIPSLEEQYSGFNKRVDLETVEKYKSTANTDRKDE